MRRRKLVLLVLLVGIALTLSLGVVSAADTTKKSNVNSNFKKTSSNTVSSEGTSTTKTIKVLIYSGQYSIGSCVSGIKTSLKTANSKKLAPGYKFTYATANTINSKTLRGYDVVAFPGGRDGDYYVRSGKISISAVKSFIKSGKGYLGICAGAYSGVKSVKGYYKAWGVAPHTVSTRPWVEGNVGMKIEPAGKALFGRSGTIPIAHYNGPAMYASGGEIVTFATYADNKCRSKGLGAITGDFYGKGRVVLSGPHPELVPRQPGILAKLVVWAANKDRKQPKLYTTVSKTQVATAATNVKAYYQKNKKLPNTVNIGGNTYTLQQYTYLVTQAIKKASSGSTSIYVRPIGAAPKPGGTYKARTLYKVTYLMYIDRLKSFITSNGRMPNYQTTSFGKISFKKYAYIYTLILDHYSIKLKLPSSLKI